MIDTLHYEHQLIVAEGDYFIVHGRFTGSGRPAAWVAADVVGRASGRGDRSRIEKRPADVRRPVSWLKSTEGNARAAKPGLLAIYHRLGALR
jgi:hypothetical protein